MTTQARPNPNATALERSQSFFNRPWVTISGVILLLLVLEGQLLYSVRQESLTWDEGDHIFAGYMSLKHHDFGLNPEHPPLVKMIAAIPLRDMNLRERQLQNRYFKTEAYLSGRDLIFQNDFETIIFRARTSASIFALMTALLAFLAAREMFGTGAGFLTLLLIMFEPNFLAHGALVTTDTGAACCLARVDGKSPVEYLDQRAQALARTFARRALEAEPSTWGEFMHLFRHAMEESSAWPH